MKSKNKSQQGFTLAEVLIVLGILSIVFGIGAVSVVRYQNTLKLTKMDSIAKEIFVVAQNQMMAAKASGEWEQLSDEYKDDLDAYLGDSMNKQPSDYPSNEQWAQEGHDYRYIMCNNRSKTNTLDHTVLDIILPYGSIEEEIRSNGCYIIEYDYTTATVYGVFYTDSSQALDYETDIIGISGLNNNKGRENSQEGKEARKNYKNNKGPIIIGYYGGGVVKDFKATNLEPIEMQVHNGDTLEVTIKDRNYGKVIDGVKANTKLTLTVTGEESKASETYLLQINETSQGTNTNQEEWWQAKEEEGVGIYTLVLDDITRPGGHFADLFPKLIPGENIIIEAQAFSQDVLCIPVKAQAYTNSLFETNYSYEENGRWHSKVSIASIRHLQNLSPEVSNLPVEVTPEWAEQKVERVIKKVEQTKSLNWDDFAPNEEGYEIKIYAYDKDISNQKELTQNKFYGISNLALVSYDGHGYTLSRFNIQENDSGNVGLFSQIGSEITSQHFTVTNVVLDTFVSESKNGGNAGSLIGEVKVKGTFEGDNIFTINTTVKALNKGNAGGLIGKMSNGTLKQCGIYLTDDEDDVVSKKTASEKYELGAYCADNKMEGSQFMIASSGGAAGGLVGKIENTVITDSFASIPVLANANGVAGGLVGENRGTTGQKTVITNSYTGGYTKEGQYLEHYGVSALGYEGVAGGFVGKDAGELTTIENSYATVSVYGSSVGGFIGTTDKGKSTYKNCYATGKVTGVSESSKKGGFIGEVKATSTLLAEKCYTLKQSNKDLIASVSGVESLDYDELIQRTSINNEQQLKREQYVYDSTLNAITYPFGMVTKTGAKDEASIGVHYGDWPVKANESSAGGDIGVVYYEIIDNKLYYHGYLATYSANESEPNYKEIMTEGTNLTNGLLTTPGKYVSEDGYMILVPEGTDLNQVAVAVSNSKDDINGGERWKLSECVQPLSKKDLFPVKGFDVYYFTKELNVFNLTYIMIGENINPYYPTLGDYVSFYFNSYFADTVDQEKPVEEKLYIRSPRHLLNMIKVEWSHSNKEQVEFIQTLDISYEDINFTENGKEKRYDYQTLGMISADYSVRQYKIEDELRGYVIKGLNVPLFGSVQSSSTIKGVTLLNSHVKASGSFASSNEGLIESCSVHAENPGQDSYAAVTIEMQDNAAGFIDTNSGTIRNSYFVGMITGNTVSGFVSTNQGIIENSYANVILLGNTWASGFVGSNNGGSIKNSFVTGSITSTGANGIAYGFMETGSNGVMENCYSALFNLSGNQIYRFGKGRGNHYISTVWLDNTYIQGDVQVGNPYDLKEQGTAMSYEDMIKKATHPKTYRYESNYEHVDKENLTYPFELLSTEDAYLKMAFWGDWPKQDLSKKVGLIYYEIIGNQLYYQGYLAEYSEDEPEVNYKEIMTEVTSPGKNVSKKGYIILVKEGTDTNGVDIRVTRNDGDNQSGKKYILSECIEGLVQQDLFYIQGFDAYYFIQEINKANLEKIVINERVNCKFYCK